MLAIQICMDIRLPIGVVDIICRTTELGVRPEVQMRYLTMHIHHYEISSKDILEFWKSRPHIEGDGPVLVADSNLDWGFYSYVA